MKATKIWSGEYCGESIIGLPEDIHYAFDPNDNPKAKVVPVDEYGIQQGTFRVTIEWIPEEE